MLGKSMRINRMLIVLGLICSLSCFAEDYTIQKFAGGGVPENIPALSANLGAIGGIAVDNGGNLYIALSDYGVVVRMGDDGALRRVAGSGISGNGGDGGPAIEGQLCTCYPMRIAVDSHGDLYISDTLNRRIRKVSNGIITTVAGGGTVFLADAPGTGAALSGPRGLTFDLAGNLVFVDGITVRRLSNGILTTVGAFPNTIASNNIAVDLTGAIYVPDLASGRTYRFANGLSILSLNAPGGIAFDSKNALYYSDGLTIHQAGIAAPVVGNGTPGFSGDGGPASSAQLSVLGFVFDALDNLYIADQGRVRKVTNGVINTVAGVTPGGLLGDGGPALSAQIRAAGTAVGNDGSVYIADYSNHRVRKISNGLVSTVAGDGIPGYGGDGGPATAAHLNYPQGVAIDSAGNLYIADTVNNRIRKVAGGVITTIAGNGISGDGGDGGAATAANLNLPRAIAFDAAGTMYLGNDTRIRMISNGVISAVPVSTSSVDCCGFITGVAVDSSGVIYASAYDGVRNQILKISGGVMTVVVTVPIPTSVAIDANDNLYISDQFYIHRLANGVLTPIAGGGPFFRDSVPARATSLVGPVGLAIGPAGKIYESDSGVVRVLTPTPTACTYATNPSDANLPSPGGTISVTIQTDPGCTWFVSDLPSWISAIEPSLGTGAGTVSLSVAANATPARSAAISIAGSVALTVSQDTGCTYSPSDGSTGRAFPASGGFVQISVSRSSVQCAWTVTNVPSWISATPTGTSQPITLNVAANSGSARTAALNISGISYTIEEAAASIPGLTLIGSLAHVVAQKPWKFTLDAVNLGATAAQARFTFTDDNRSPVAMPLTFPQLVPPGGPLLASVLDRTIAENGQILMDASGSLTIGSPVGTGQVSATGNVSGFGIFSYPPLGWNAVVPLETRKADKYILPFDNTGTLATGVAVSVVVPGQISSVPVVIRDDTGAQTGPPFGLSGLGPQSFMLNQQFPATAGKRGTIEFDAPVGGQISVLGLRANGPALTTLPVLASTDTPGGAIAHATYNGGFTSVFYIVNTGAASASFTLSFFDESGNPLTVPLSLPQTGATPTTSALTQNLAAGAMLVVETVANDAAASVVGSAQLTTTGNVSGFEIFRWTTFGQEASVPLETRTPAGFVLVFDDTGGLTTGVALSNVAASAATVTAKIYDDAGVLLQTASINLAGRGHTSFLLPDSYSVTANKRGMVEFVVPAGGKINAVGLRAKGDGTLTTIPVLVK